MPPRFPTTNHPECARGTHCGCQRAGATECCYCGHTLIPSPQPVRMRDIPFNEDRVLSTLEASGYISRATATVGTWSPITGYTDFPTGNREASAPPPQPPLAIEVADDDGSEENFFND